jgi:hypothetical protein
MKEEIGRYSLRLITEYLMICKQQQNNNNAAIAEFKAKNDQLFSTINMLEDLQDKITKYSEDKTR